MKKEMTGYPSIDKPWQKYYNDSEINVPDQACCLWDFLYECNKNHLDYVALNYFGKRISYAEMFKEIDMVAQSLRSIGVRVGDVISVCPLNTPEFVYLLYAINKVGAVSNWIALTSSVDDLHKQIVDTKSKIVFAVTPACEKIEDAVINTTVEEVIAVPVENSMPLALKIAIRAKKQHSANHCMSWKKFIGLKGSYSYCERINYSNLALIQYTGGSTGIPKGVMLSNENLNAYYIDFTLANKSKLISYKERETFLACVPLFLAFGVSSCCHGPLCNSMELVLAPDPNPTSVTNIIIRQKPNHIIAGKPLVDALIGKVRNTNTDLSYVFSVLYGGEGKDSAWEKECELALKENGLKVPIQNGYGMTETAAAVLIPEKNNYGLIPVGRTIAKIVNPEDELQELGYNLEGELCLSGSTIMMGYFEREKDTDEAFLFDENGKWLRTGDLAKISDEGVITITGRKKRIYYKLGHDNVPIRVYPMRIEEVLRDSEHVEKSAVVGIKSDKVAYRTIAYLIPSTDDRKEDEVLKSAERICLEKLPDSHVPDEYVLLKEFPLTRAGKVDYNLLETMAEERF